jgi:ABC-type multidrug transport system fused ATPase/permease subunit
MVAALLLGQLLVLGQEYLSQLLGQRLVLALRCDLYAKLQRLSLRFHDTSSVGDLVYRITGDAAALQDVVIYGVVPLGIQLLTAAAIAGTIFLLDARIGVAALALVPVLLAWTAWSSERVKARSRGLARAESVLYAVVNEALGAIRAVKAFAAEDAELARFAGHARAGQRAYVGVMTLSAVGSLVTETIVGLGTAAAVGLGALAVLRGDLTVGELLVFVAYLQALYGPVTQLARSAMVVQRSSASVERLAQILDQEDEHARSGGHRLPAVAGRITLDRVSFAYDAPPAPPALRDLSLEVAPGEMVALVGRSGAGKTSLVGLVLRFYAPRAGRVLLDGADVAALDARWLRRQIALVPQEPILFSASLAENIAYGRPGASERDVTAAGHAAGLDDVVAALPDGYETQVGERGVRLSGGQRQRLALARAFLKDAPVLVLDEPTSSLDTVTERHVFESLARLARGRTTLVIAHRLATVQRADRLAVLEAGRLVEQGTHRGLLDAGGAYARLCRDQLLGPDGSPDGSPGRPAARPHPQRLGADPGRAPGPGGADRTQLTRPEKGVSRWTSVT